MTFRKRITRKTERRGTAIVLVLVFTLIFAIVIGAILSDVAQETRMTHRARLVTDTIESAKSSVRSMSNNIRDIASITPAQLGGDFANLDAVIKSIDPVRPQGARFITDGGGRPLTYVRDLGPNDLQFRPIEDINDEFFGYSTMRLDYELVSYLQQDISTNELLGFPGMGVRSRVKIDYIPLYQFAIFYEPDLELHPGPQMEVTGRVHANGDLYMSAVNRLRFHNRVSATGGIYRWLTGSGATQGGDVQIRDRQNQFRSMVPDNNPSDDNNWLDHNDQNWYEESLKRWQGNVMDSAHGVQNIRPPLPPGSNTRDMIARVTMTEESESQRAIKFERQSDIVVVGDPDRPATWRIYVQKFNPDGSFQERLGPFPNFSVGGNPFISTGEFYDGQQLTVVKTLDVNLDVLRRSSFINFGTARGAIYVSTTPTNQTDWDDGYVLAPRNRDPQVVRNADGRVILDNDGFPADANGNRLANLGWMAGGTTAEQGDPAYMPAVRIIRGEHVPRNADGGFAVYTDRPMYIVGNLNTTNKATLVVGGDSVTITEKKLELAKTNKDGQWFRRDAGGNLITGNNSDGTKRGFSTYMGNNWRSSFYNWDSWRRESAGTVTTNAILLMGNTPTIYQPDFPDRPDEYSGGAHNVMRYLERWGTHNFNGSMIVLFDSGVSVRMYRDDGYSGNKMYRNPPTRNYSWDNSLQTAVPPPGFPVVIEVNTYPMEPVSLDYAQAHAPASE